MNSTARKLLLGNCFWREGFEAAFGPDRMGEKGGCCLLAGELLHSFVLPWLLALAKIAASISRILHLLTESVCDTLN